MTYSVHTHDTDHVIYISAFPLKNMETALVWKVVQMDELHEPIFRNHSN